MWKRPLFLLPLLCITLLIGASAEGILWQLPTSFISQTSSKHPAQLKREDDSENHQKRVAPPKMSTIQQRQLILQRQLFGVPLTSNSSNKEQHIPKVNDANFEFVLLGTIDLKSDDSRAIIMKKKNQKQKLYKKGDTIENAIIKEILRQKIILSINKEDKILEMNESITNSPETTLHTQSSTVKSKQKTRKTLAQKILTQ